MLGAPSEDTCVTGTLLKPAIIGAVVGGVLLIAAAIAGLAVYFKRKRKNMRLFPELTLTVCGNTFILHNTDVVEKQAPMHDRGSPSAARPNTGKTPSAWGPQLKAESAI